MSDMSVAARLIRPVLAKQFEQRPGEEGQLQQARDTLDAMGGRMKPPPGTAHHDEVIAGVPSERIVPRAAGESPCILYLHGGAYMLGSRISHRGLAAHLAHAVGGIAVLPEYRLAPEHPHPAAIDDALAVYLALTEEFSPEDIIISGDSAGGGLSVALTHRLLREGHPLPAGVAVISPWTDLAGTGETLVTNADTEIMLDPTRITEIADYYHPDTASDDPYVSPLYGYFEGFPPLLAQVGGDEILLDDSRRLVERATAAGVQATLRIWPGMWHVWHMLSPWVPEARRAINEYARWVIGALDDASQRPMASEPTT